MQINTLPIFGFFEAPVAEDKVTRIDDKIATLKQQMRQMKALEVQIDEAPDKHARAAGRGTRP